LAQVSDQVNRAAESGGFERASSHLSRSPMVLDERGWNELATKFDRLLSECERVAAASAKRLAARDHAGEIQATAVLMLFESVAQSAGRSGASPGRRRTRRQASARR
jgi:hypothetical protein